MFLVTAATCVPPQAFRQALGNRLGQAEGPGTPLSAHQCRQKPVLEWIASIDNAATTSVNVGELLTGVRRLPVGRRSDQLLASIEQTLDAFAGSVLPDDEAAARSYAELQERRRAAGAPLNVEDGMIAAICLTRSATLATRNINDFEGLGLVLIDPWAARS